MNKAQACRFGPGTAGVSPAFDFQDFASRPGSLVFRRGSGELPPHEQGAIVPLWAWDRRRLAGLSLECSWGARSQADKEPNLRWPLTTDDWPLLVYGALLTSKLFVSTIL